MSVDSHAERMGAGLPKWVATGSVALLLAACGGAGSNATTAVAPVQLVSFRGPGFSVGLPAKPKRVTLTVQEGGRTVKVRLYATKAGQVVFEVGEVRAGLGPGRLSQGVVASTGGTARASATTYDGFPATDVRAAGVSIAGKKSTLFLREVNAPKRTVLLIYIVVGGDLAKPPPGYTAFASSLRIR